MNFPISVPMQHPLPLRMIDTAALKQTFPTAAFRVRTKFSGHTSEHAQLSRLQQTLFKTPPIHIAVSKTRSHAVRYETPYVEAYKCKLQIKGTGERRIVYNPDHGDRTLFHRKSELPNIK